MIKERINQRIEKLVELKQNKDDGKLDLIPFYHHFPKLSTVLPGLFRGSLNTICAGTGVGKSSIARYLSIIVPYEISKMYKFNYKTIYFALEESQDEFVDNMICMYLNIKFGLEIDRLTLNSMYEKSIDSDILDKVKEVQSDVEDLLTCVDVVDSISNPTGIYKYVRNYSNKIGTHHYKTIKIDGKDTKIYSHYEQHDDTFVLVVVDHVSLLQSEKDESGRRLNLHETMSKWSTSYCLGQICKHYNFCVLNVQQLNMSSTDINHYKFGKLEPTMDKAGDNKLILRDNHVVLSLYSPFKNGEKTHDGHNMMEYKDTYRSLKILKSRFGRSGIKVPLKFYGAIGKFEEI